MNAWVEKMYLVCGVGLLVSVMACSTDQATAVSKPASLYDRLGGKPAITAVVDDFVSNVANDARINGRFAGTDIPKLKGLLVDQVCGAAGGPCVYKGRDMKTMHAGMGISSAEFSALVEDLVVTFNKFKVPKTEQNELLGLLGPMKSDIVEAP